MNAWNAHIKGQMWGHLEITTFLPSCIFYIFFPMINSDSGIYYASMAAHSQYIPSGYGHPSPSAMAIQQQAEEPVMARANVRFERKMAPKRGRSTSEHSLMSDEEDNGWGDHQNYIYYRNSTKMSDTKRVKQRSTPTVETQV